MSPPLQAAVEQLAFHATRLSAGTRLLLLLLRLRFALSDADVACLEAHFSPIVDDLADQGWEERTDASVTHLLRTGLNKSGKEAASSAPQQLTRPSDAKKLQKHITLLADRLHKGLRPTAGKADEVAGSPHKG